MSKDVILLAALAAGVYLVMSKQAQARAVAAQSTAGGIRINPGNIPASGVKTSVNGDMWARLMGNSFTSLVKGLTTSDGKAITTGENGAFYNQLQAGDVRDVEDMPGFGGYDLSGAMDDVMGWA